MMNTKETFKAWCKEEFSRVDLLAEEALYDLEKKIEKSDSFDEIKVLVALHKELTRRRQNFANHYPKGVEYLNYISYFIIEGNSVIEYVEKIEEL